jgi:hypothetical protein
VEDDLDGANDRAVAERLDHVRGNAKLDFHVGLHGAGRHKSVSYEQDDNAQQSCYN